MYNDLFLIYKIKSSQTYIQNFLDVESIVVPICCKMVVGDMDLYLLYLIPSILSFGVSLYVCKRIFQDKDLKRKLYQQLTLFLFLGSMFQTSSWFLGPKFREGKGAMFGDETSLEIKCEIQEYMYQFGVALQGTTSTSICIISFHLLSTSKIPRFVWYNHPAFLSLAVSSVLTIVSASLGSAIAYCRYYPDPVPNDRSDILYTLYATFIGPLVLSVVIIFFLYIVISLILRRKSDVYGVAIKTVVWQMLSYGLIFAVAFFPPAIILTSYASGGIGGEVMYLLVIIAALSQSLCGAALALQYFYFKRAYPLDNSDDAAIEKHESDFQMSRRLTTISADLEMPSSSSRVTADFKRSSQQKSSSFTESTYAMGMNNSEFALFS